MWRCPKCRSKVDDSFEVCWSCGTTADGIEDPNFVTADEADPIPDEEDPERTDVDDPLADFAGPPMPDLVDCYMGSNTGLLPISWSSDNGSHLFVDSVDEGSGGSCPEPENHLVSVRNHLVSVQFSL